MKGNDLACHKLYLALYCFLMRLKNRGTKRSILNILKISYDKFTWNGKKYHAYVDMVDSAAKIVWLWDLDARVNSTLSTNFWA